MIINDTLKVSTIAIANVAANGPIGTAATTVDIASSFTINQTTAAIALTIPAPTDATAGDRITVGNIGTVPVTVAGVSLISGEFAEWVWSGTAWLFMDGGRNAGAVIPVAAVAAGNFVVTHNMAMPTGSFGSVLVRAYNPAGNEIQFKRNTAADTANATGFSSPTALAAPNLPVTFYFTPLA
jgi:hypothetical protein